MAGGKEFSGEDSQYENEKDHQYCMRDSWESRNNHEMNVDLGYNEMSDLANTAHPPTKMEGAHRNEQEGPRLAIHVIMIDRNVRECSST